MSILSAISTGFWSRLGDSVGRKPILTIFMSGALLMCVDSLFEVDAWLILLHREAVFVLVMRPDSFFARHAERLILVGPFVEGFVGGLSTFNGAFHAFVLLILSI